MDVVRRRGGSLRSDPAPTRPGPTAVPATHFVLLTLSHKRLRRESGRRHRAKAEKDPNINSV